MSKLSASVHFNVPPERAWSVVTDFEHAAENIEGIKKLEILTPGVTGKGFRWRETRMMFKKEATEEMEISEWVPPKYYTTEAESCGCHYTCKISLTPEAGGTRVEMSMDAKPLTLPAKIMSGVMGWMMSGSIRKLFEKDLNDLKRHAEGRTSSSTAPAGA